MTSSYAVVLAPQAEDDIRAAFLWYQDRNARAADAFRAEVYAAIDSIALTPLGKSADQDGNRKRILRRYPYSVFYDVLGDTITILAVAHHRLRPRYWNV